MEKSTISVEGRGAIHVVPDVTRLKINVNQWFENYEKAYAQGKENSSWMVKILEYNKKPGDLAKTISFNIEDHTFNEYDDNNHYIGQVKDGVMLNQVFKVDLPIDAQLVNCIVKGVGKFVPSAQIDIDYALQDERPSQLKMLKRAVVDAREKAEIMAEASGCSLGNVLSINYEFKYIYVASQARSIHSNSEAMSSTSNSLEITPDDLVVSDTVSVVWELINLKL